MFSKSKRIYRAQTCPSFSMRILSRQKTQTPLEDLNRCSELAPMLPIDLWTHYKFWDNAESLQSSLEMPPGYIRQIKNDTVNSLYISYFLSRPCHPGLWYLKGFYSCGVKWPPLVPLQTSSQPSPVASDSHRQSSQPVLVHLSHLNRPSDINVTEPSPHKFSVPLISWDGNIEYTHPEI